MVLGIGFGADNEEGACDVQSEEPFEIHIAPIHDVKSPGFGQENIEHIDFVQFAVGNMNKGLMTRNGRVRYELKTPWRNGTTHVIFEPLDFISRLVSLVPKPHVNLTRFHGVFASNSQYRVLVTPAKRGRGKTVKTLNDQTPTEKQASMTWAKRFKRVFDIDIETCSECGGDVKIIASIEDPAVIRRILAHLDDNATSAATALLPDCRASPTVGLLV